MDEFWINYSDGRIFVNKGTSENRWFKGTLTIHGKIQTFSITNIEIFCFQSRRHAIQILKKAFPCAKITRDRAKERGIIN